MALTKTQINHFERRMNILVDGAVADKIREHYPLKDKLTTQDKVGMIASGQARFMEERFTGPECPYCPGLFSSFEFPGEEDIATYNAAMTKKIDKALSKARRMAQRLTDNFVLGRIEFEEAADKLEAAIFWEE